MPAGRPSKYCDEYVEQAYKLALLGLTDVQMADFFEVCEATFTNWKSEHPELLASIRRGKGKADAQVAASLYQAAIGYQHPDVDIRVIDGQIIQTELTKHYPPDYRAASLWLRNRQPKMWRDKVEQQVTVSHEQLTDTELTDKLRALGVEINEG